MSKRILLNYCKHFNVLNFSSRGLYICFLVLLSLQSSSCVNGKQAICDKRVVKNIDQGWKFNLSDVSGAPNSSYDDSGWLDVDLPHDWSIEGQYDRKNPMAGRCGYLPAGIGWYRKELNIPASWQNKRVMIEFDGVFRKSTVFIDGQQLGYRPYGWISFGYDISNHIAGKQSVTVAVRVDNKDQQAARWYTGSGIYGHVNLVKTEKIHVDRWGTQIVAGTDGRIDIKTTVRNECEIDKKVKCKTRIYDRHNKLVAENVSNEEIIKADGSIEIFQQNLEVVNPELWSPQSPVLYRAVTFVYHQDKAVDRYETDFGLRSIHWDSLSGFSLNGTQTKLRGMCMHIDAGPLGAAVPDKILETRLRQLKRMGCNAVRTSHYPRPRIFYQLCDKLGIMVMDEVFDGWSKKAAKDYGAQDFSQWWKIDMTEWLKRDRNHPSIIIWSVGNETHGPIASELVDVCHKLDPTRAVTSGSSNTAAMDVHGENGASENMNYTGPKSKPFVGTECVHTWHVRGMYRTQSWYRDGYKPAFMLDIPNLTETEIFDYDWTANHSHKRCFNSSYDNSTVRDTIRHFQKKVADNDWFSGSFRWTAYDYIGEADYISGGWPFKIFNSGVMDLCGFEKDVYYLYQSMWADKQDSPMVHILPHWTHPTMKKGTMIPVWVYSNCDSVKLYLNNELIGSDSPNFDKWDQIQCDWMVPWVPGVLKAEGFVAGKKVCQQIIETADVPSKIHLDSDTKSLLPNASDIAQITVATTDNEGRFYPYGENRVYFKVLGPAKLKALGNGSPVDVQSHKDDNRQCFMGLAKAFVQAENASGDILLLAASIIGEKRQITSRQVSIDFQQISLRGRGKINDYEIYYSVDGSEPDNNSLKYHSSFLVNPGTTVKAAIYVNGNKLLCCQETFGPDQGLHWGKIDVSHDGDIYQAEDAEMINATVKTNDVTYVDFDSKEGSIQWSVTTDADRQEVILIIHFCCNDSDGQRLMQISLNDRIIKADCKFNNTGSWDKNWARLSVPVTLTNGTNLIKLSTTGHSGPNIDYLEIINEK